MRLNEERKEEGRDDRKNASKRLIGHKVMLPVLHCCLFSEQSDPLFHFVRSRENVYIETVSDAQPLDLGHV
jgi:hypothetical protein